MSHKSRILIVDDEAENLSFISEILSELYEIDAVLSGSEALQLLSTNEPDLILLDVNMPVMDGITLIKELRTLPSYKFTPLLMLTTESGLDKKTEGKAAGATGWIVKPFNPDQLLAVLKKVIR